MKLKRRKFGLSPLIPKIKSHYVCIQEGNEYSAWVFERVNTLINSQRNTPPEFNDFFKENFSELLA